MKPTKEASLVVLFTETVRRATIVVLYEGLPHQLFESRLLELELQTKAVLELNGYPFYPNPLTYLEEDAKHLTNVLTEATSYKPFSGEKLCGGFHPDYAVEWHVDEGQFRTLICFGCREVKLIAPGYESRNDLDANAFEKLQKLLIKYRKNRPVKM